MKTRTGYLIRRGKTYYAAWTVAGKKFMRSTHKKDRRDAQKELSRIMQPFLVEDEVRTLENVKARIEGAKAEIAAHDEARNPPLLIQHAWTAFEGSTERPDSGERTLADYHGAFSRFSEWLRKTHHAILDVRDVSKTIAAEYAAHLSEGHAAPNTFNKTVNALDLIFRTLRQKARSDINPWETVNRKRLNPQSRRELTVDELRRVCGAAEEDLRILFALGIYTGLRLGDCATLRWGEVDLARAIIRRIPLKTARRRAHPVVIPVHPALRGMLAEIPPEQKTDYVLPKTAALYARDNAALSKRIQDHFTACGVRTVKPGTGFEVTKDKDGKERREHTGKRAVLEVGFHSLRHTFVSLCRESNAPLAVVEAIVGHSGPAMTRHYTHISELAATAAVNALPAVVGDMPAPKALPARSRDDELREIIERMTPRTLKRDKVQALAILTRKQ